MSINGGLFAGPSIKPNARYVPKAITSAPKKGATNNEKEDEEEDVENVYDETANLFLNTKTGGSSSFMVVAVYNQRTRKIMETMNVTFDDLSTMDFEQRDASRNAHAAPATLSNQNLQNLNASTKMTDSAPIPTNSSTEALTFPNTSQDVDELQQQLRSQQQDIQAQLQSEVVYDNDADHAGCQDSFKSTSGGTQFLGESWSPIYCDLKSTIAISCNYVQHSRTKHITVRYHFIKEHVEKGMTELYFVKTDYQLVNIFTKALSVDRFNYLVRRLGMRNLSPQELERIAKSQ
uniref:Retrovirus-related Pol polyprotein from transposon TNT 1-94 n=1 Tax=Tanacetum cinerariifolium TaxID=118510 RepID=A0A699H1G0_TANCI|nr:retrovirus-related Pol polyprotein from transposon TNT 1-94 [Tanacetum cinerariifolium]